MVDVLYEAEPQPAATDAEAGYGGALRFPDAPAPYVVANFVSTIDGAVSLGLRDGSDSAIVGGHSSADRYVMAMLRAAADVILIGAHTLADTPGHQWTPETVARGRGPQLATYRRSLGRDGRSAPLVVVTASGRLPPHAALSRPATPVAVLTTERGADVLAQTPGSPECIVVPGEGRLDAATIIGAVEHAYHPRLLLTEGGPTLMGTLIAAARVSELFFTLSPRVAGRDSAHPRLGMVEGFAAGPEALQDYALVSVRRAAAALLLRYRR